MKGCQGMLRDVVVKTFLFLSPLLLSGQIRINCGGPAVGNFSADQSFIGGYTISAVTPTGTDPVYSTKRYGDFSYLTNVSLAGSYTINLYFIESTVSTVGARIFNVKINGTVVLSNYDVFADVGLKPTVKSFQVNLTQNANIQFSTVVRSAFVNAIEIIPNVPQILSLFTSPSQIYKAVIKRADGKILELLGTDYPGLVYNGWQPIQ